MMRSIAKGPGVTVIICCHNSAALLPATLEHLSRQIVDPRIKWEVLVVDNASTDDTRAIAREAAAGVPALRVVDEPQLGLAHARARGIADARYDLLSFVDDDNWVCRAWVQTVYDVMRDHPDIGALGGNVEPAFETARPAWFGHVENLYAIGPDNGPSGDVTTINMLCGAGLNVRHAALADIRSKGFRSIAVGRQGGSLGAGEDLELTYFLRLAGWKLWLDPRLRLTHYLPARRLRWDYARRLAYGSAFATAERDALVYACKPRRSGLRLSLRRLRERWFWQLGNSVKNLVATGGGTVTRMLGMAREGDRGVLRAEFARGRFAGLVGARRWYNARSTEIRQVMARIRGERPIGG